MKQQFRTLALIGIAKTLGDALNTQSINEKDGLGSNCISCKKFDEPSEICKKYNQRPPARIIALGCEFWEDNDTIPF